jgi:hypothetical protein
MADGAIDVHIMTPQRPKRVEAFDDTTVWLWLDWHCMGGMVGGTKHLANCTLEYGLLAGIAWHVAAMDAVVRRREQECRKRA